MSSLLSFTYIVLLASALCATASAKPSADIPGSALRRAWVERDADQEATLLVDARAYLRGHVIPTAVHRWLGTPWTMAVIRDGLRPDSEFPEQSGRGISCSWFVVRALQDSGIRLDRPRAFAGAIAVDIQHSTLDRGARLWRRRGLTPQALHEAAIAMGPGWYVIGLSYHVGLIQVRGDQVDFVHASYLDPQQVVREPVLSSAAIADSRYFVISPLLGDNVVRAWLDGTPIRFRPLRKRARRG